MAEDFNTIYEELRPVLENLETRRLELKAKGNKNGLIAGGICLLIGVIVTAAIGFNWIGIGVSAVIACIVWYSCIAGQSGKLTMYYKQDVIAAIISRLCENAEYQPDSGIPEQRFMGSGLFNTSPDRYRSEDQITGCIGKTSFICSEIVAEEKRVTTDSKGRRTERWVDIFRGFFFIADFQKDFRAQTVVFRNSWFRLFTGKQRVKLENPEFEKRFDTFSTDQVEARYLLTPGMMERLLELDRKFPGKITLSFVNSCVIVAIPDSKDHFETSIWQSQLNNDSIREEFYTLIALFGIVNDLNLNLRIWTKE